MIRSLRVKWIFGILLTGVFLFSMNSMAKKTVDKPSVTKESGPAPVLVLPPKDLAHQELKVPVTDPVSIVQEELQVLNVPSQPSEVAARPKPVATKNADPQNHKTSRKDLEESQIPVLTPVTKAKEESSGLIYRMVFSLVIIILAAGALVLFGKWWSRNHRPNDMQTKIRVLTQHHLGPKKSLAIVRVAGESILLGVTDHSINMIKTLSFINDEIPEDIPDDFSAELDELENETESQVESVKATTHLVESKDKVTLSKEDKNFDDYSFGNIRQHVANKLKEMRTL